MTPKEKADELFNKYATYVVMWASDINTTHQNCKQCALIAVDEIIEECYNWTGGTNDGWETKRFDFWQEVKQEIENL